MNRRTFTKLFAASPIAAPAMANAAAAGISPDMALGAGNAANQLGGTIGYGIPANGPKEDYGGFLKDRIKDLLENRDKAFARALRNVSKLDPDLASMRSLSLTMRRIIQARRDEQAMFDAEHGNCTEQLAKWAKRSVGLGDLLK